MRGDGPGSVGLIASASMRGPGLRFASWIALVGFVAPGVRACAEDRLDSTSPLARSSRPLLPVPRRGGEAEGRARPAAGPAMIRRGATRARRSCPAAATRACSGSGSRRRDAAGREEALAREKAVIAAWIDQGRRPPDPSPRPSPPGPTSDRGGARFWSFRPIATPRGPRRSATRRGCGRRSTPSCSRGSRQGAGLRARGRPADPDPPPHVRPDRPAADARGGRRLRGRPSPRRLRAAGRSPARLAPLRRALGPALARRRRLRRQRRLHRAGRRPAVRLQVPRLPRPLAQRRPPAGTT